MHDHPSPTDYLYLAALAAIATGTATTCWIATREIRHAETRRASPITPARPVSGPSRRQASSRGRGRLALANPAVAEATARRRLLEAHLREQLAAEMDEVKRDIYARGYADGIARLAKGERS